MGKEQKYSQSYVFVGTNRLKLRKGQQFCFVDEEDKKRAIFLTFSFAYYFAHTDESFELTTFDSVGYNHNQFTTQPTQVHQKFCDCLISHFESKFMLLRELVYLLCATADDGSACFAKIDRAGSKIGENRPRGVVNNQKSNALGIINMDEFRPCWDENS